MLPTARICFCRFEGRVPEAVLDISTSDSLELDLPGAVRKLETDVQGLVKDYIAAMEKIKLREGIRVAMSISSLGNKFFQVC